MLLQKRNFSAESLSHWKPAHFTHVVHKVGVWTRESRCQAGHALLLVLISWEKTKRYLKHNFLSEQPDCWQLYVHSSDSKEAPRTVCLMKRFKEGHSSGGDFFPPNIILQTDSRVHLPWAGSQGFCLLFKHSSPQMKLSCSVTTSPLNFWFCHRVYTKSDTDTTHPSTHKEWMVFGNPSEAHKSRNRILTTGDPEKFFSELLQQAAQIHQKKKIQRGKLIQFLSRRG